MSNKSHTTKKQVVEFLSIDGGKIYQIPLELFPGFWGFVYLVFFEDMCVLIDTGSGFGKSNFLLEEGFKYIGEKIGKELSLESVTHVLITHGHIDHFGGLTFVRPRTPGQIGVHELDRRNITNYEERLAVVIHRLTNYFFEAGLSNQSTDRLISMYQINKQLFHSVSLDFAFEANGLQVGPFKMLHVPGHCAGHVVIQFHDILFSGDHILNRVTPHMAPEAVTRNTGLGHYLESLLKVKNWANDITITLGGHEDPVRDLNQRIYDIRAHHMLRLEKILDIVNSPKSIAEVSYELFGKPSGYDAILALEESGAHVEYLYQRGHLAIDNIADLENNNGLASLKYVRI